MPATKAITHEFGYQAENIRISGTEHLPNSADSKRHVCCLKDYLPTVRPPGLAGNCAAAAGDSPAA